MTNNQIAVEAAEKICGNYPARPTRAECAAIIQAAIEKRDWQWHDACCGASVVPCNPEAVKRWIAAEAEIMSRAAARASEEDWPKDYDLTSFLHGDKTQAELVEANNNLFKIARKYCLENKRLRSARAGEPSVREALLDVRIEYMNRRIELPKWLHGKIENALACSATTHASELPSWEDHDTEH